MMWWLIFEKKPFQPWREIWIQVVVIVLQLYQRNANHCPTLTTELFYVICFFDHTNYISLGNYCFIVFMGKIIWLFSTNFQNRRLFLLHKSRIICKANNPIFASWVKSRKWQRITFFRIKQAKRPQNIRWLYEIKD